jgi:hypothetical protein
MTQANDWRERLQQRMGRKNGPRPPTGKTEMSRFIAEAVLPAFHEVAREMESLGRSAVIRDTGACASINVEYQGRPEFAYSIQGRVFPTQTVPYAEIRFRERQGLRLISVESMFRDAAAPYGLADIDKDEIINHFVENYTRRVARPANAS